MNVRLLLVGLVLTVLAGCAGTRGPLGLRMPEQFSTASHVKCERWNQEECITLEIYNLEWDAEHPVMRGLDRAPWSKEERQRRAQFVPMLLKKEFVSGTGNVRASAPRYFDLYVFRAERLRAEHLSAYQGGERMKVSVEDVTSSAQPPVFDPSFDLGPPTRVYRVRTSSQDPGVVRIQFPKSMIKFQFSKELDKLVPTTYLLLCPPWAVYPNPVGKYPGGLWVSKESIQWLLAKNSRLWVQTVLSTTYR
jgi:hypothetical protein